MAFIDDAPTALALAVETVARAAQVSCRAFVACDGGFRVAAASAERDGETIGFDARVGRNDGAVVRLLATRAPVELEDVRSALAGTVAFPMFARNRLTGMLVCGDRAIDDEGCAPNLIAAIASLADALGVALDLLRIEALERELVELRAALPSV